MKRIKKVSSECVKIFFAGGSTKKGGKRTLRG
jgi:hypothetical protein